MLYTAQTKVYAAKLKSSIFGTTVNCTILANNEEEAKDLAKINFDNYCQKLFEHHGEIFKYGDIKLC